MQSKKFSSNRKAHLGFTLIELMIVVAIIAVLLTIAMPNYSDSVRRGNRSIARAHLLDMANRQQEFFLNNKTYATNLTQLGYIASSIGISKKGQILAAGAADSMYDFSVTTASAATYSMAAAPQNSQSQDAECGSFTLTSTGTKSASGSLGIDCWG